MNIDEFTRIKFDRIGELEHLREECRALEEKAGISKEMEDAHYPSIFANMDMTGKEYFEYQASHLEGETRILYFSVNDTELRKKTDCDKKKNRCILSIIVGRKCYGGET